MTGRSFTVTIRATISNAVRGLGLRRVSCLPEHGCKQAVSRQKYYLQDNVEKGRERKVTAGDEDVGERNLASR